MAGRRVLAARLDSAGDVLLTGPAVRAIADNGDHVTLLASHRGREAAQLLPGVEDVVVFDAPWVLFDAPDATASAMQELVGSIGDRGFDEAVIFTSFHQSPLPLALLLRMARVGRISAISVDYPGSLLDVRHSVPDDIHEVERNLSLVRAAGFEVTSGESLRVDVPRRSDHDGRYVVVHPGAAVPARAWSPDRYRDLIGVLAASDRQVVVTGGPDEVELCNHVIGSTPGVIDASGSGTLGDLAATLQDASALICGNTGPAHLAAAVGCPVVSLFAATVPEVRWRPWNVAHVVLGDSSVPCRHCRARRCPVAGHPCLSNVQVDDVVTALDEIEKVVQVCAS